MCLALMNTLRVWLPKKFASSVLLFQFYRWGNWESELPCQNFHLVYPSGKTHSSANCSVLGVCVHWAVFVYIYRRVLRTSVLKKHLPLGG
jgi:hypothetical protein